MNLVKVSVQVLGRALVKLVAKVTRWWMANVKVSISMSRLLAFTVNIFNSL